MFYGDIMSLQDLENNSQTKNVLVYYLLFFYQQKVYNNYYKLLDEKRSLDDP